VQPEIAKLTRACTYDRRGAGFSDAGPLPRTSTRIVDELHSALTNAGVGRPYILVGHAFGGINTRAFAYRFMPEVAGLVLVDTDTGDVDPPDKLEREHKIFAQQGAELRACRDAISAGRPLRDVPPPTLQGVPCEQRFFRGFPERAWSPDLNNALLRMVQTSPALYQEVVSELEEMPGDEVWLKQHQQSLGNRPIRVLTAASSHTDDENTPTDVHLRHLQNQYERALSQARFLELSSNAKQIFAYHSGSAYIQLDQPALVIGAIREVWEQSGGGR
jgi:pimeloyl-ACP methyl ester carboxylesterase